MNLRRQFILLLMFSAIVLIFILKLFWIQVAATENYSHEHRDLLTRSIRQRSERLILDNGRGDFADRHLRKLTGTPIQALAVFPNAELSASPQSGRIAEILHLSEEDWRKRVQSLHGPILYGVSGAKVPVPLSERQAEAIRRLRLPGLAVVTIRRRYPDNEMARQLIGFIAEDPERAKQRYGDKIWPGLSGLPKKIGESGLEKSFEMTLHGVYQSEMTLYTDAANHDEKTLRIQHDGRPSPFYPVTAVTTIDSDIQREVETVMDRYRLKEGAVVILDARNADILAMASRPQFNPEQVNPDAGDWGNRALHAYAPGSVFKTVIAAAALDRHAVSPKEMFHCEGKLGKYGFSCWKKGGHGWISFEDAYAQSCNITFAKTAERLTSQEVEDYARRLGLDQQVGWRVPAVGNGGAEFAQLDHEEAGCVFGEPLQKAGDPGILIQTAIGQRDVRMTPLQGANMVVTLLHHGVVHEARAVKDIRYRNNEIKNVYPVQTMGRQTEAVSGRTSAFILKAMRLVVERGTGQVLKAARWGIAGKTGTAQVVRKGEPRVHQWFIGYFPADRPRFAIAAAALYRPADSRAIQLYMVRDIVNALADQLSR